MPEVGKCCTLVHLQFVFTVPFNVFFFLFNNISIKNSAHSNLHFLSSMKLIDEPVGQLPKMLLVENIV